MKNSINGLVVALCLCITCLLVSTSGVYAADYESPYGSSHSYAALISPGNKSFQIQNVPTGYYCEWYVNGVHKETDQSTWLDHNPNFSWNCNSTVEVKALIYNSSYSYINQYHKWNLTVNLPPYTPSNPNPYDNKTNVSINPYFSWSGGDPNGDNVTYVLKIKKGTLGNWTNYYPSTNTTHYSLSNIALDFDETYYWKIFATDIHGQLTKSHTDLQHGWKFTTVDNQPPNTPSNPTPTDNAINVSRNPYFSWAGGDPDGDNVTYILKIKKGTLGSWSEYHPSTNTTHYSLNSIDLDFDATYYWKIFATDVYGQLTKSHSDLQNGWKFTTVANQPPFTPSNPDPNNDETDVSINPYFNWSGGDPDGHSVTYTFRIKKGVAGSWDEYTNLSSSNYSLNGLDYSSVYYWKVEATDQYGASTNSHSYTQNGWKFTTNNGPPPSNPQYISIPSTELYPTHNYSITVDYTDANGASDIEYVYLQIAQNGDMDENKITLRVNPNALIPNTVQLESTNNVSSLTTTRTPISNGFRVTWNFELKWNWVNCTNVDFWAYADDDDGQTSSFVLNNCSKDYTKELAICSSVESADPVTANDDYTVDGTIMFIGCQVYPDDWGGISVEMRQNTPTNTVDLDDDGVNSTNYSLTWNTDDNDVGTYDIYIVPVNSNNTSQNLSSETYYDKETVTVEPDLTPTRFEGSLFVDKTAKYGVPIRMQAKLQVDGVFGWTSLDGKLIEFYIQNSTGAWVLIEDDDFSQGSLSILFQQDLTTGYFLQDYTSRITQFGFAENYFTPDNSFNPGVYQIKAVYGGDNQYTSSELICNLSIESPTWLQMLYMGADNDLETEAKADVEQMLSAHNNPNVAITFMVDLHNPIQNQIPQWNWTETKMGTIVENGYIMSPYPFNGGEAEMNYPSTLGWFIDSCLNNFLATNSSLILWDHGGNWTKDSSIQISQSGGIFKGIIVDSSNSWPTLKLEEIHNLFSTKGYFFDVLGFDACLMGSIETMYYMKDFTDYFVASEANIPGSGFDYSYLKSTHTTNTTTPSQFGTNIVDLYYSWNLLPITLGCWYTGGNHLLNILSKLENLSNEIIDSYPYDAALKNNEKQSFTNSRLSSIDFGNGSAFDTITPDLRDFLLDLASNTGIQNVKNLAFSIATDLVDNNFRIAFHQRWFNNDLGGLSIFIPEDDIYFNKYYNTYWFRVPDLITNYKWDDLLISIFDTEAPSPPTFSQNSTPNIGEWYNNISIQWTSSDNPIHNLGNRGYSTSFSNNSSVMPNNIIDTRKSDTTYIPPTDGNYHFFIKALDIGSSQWSSYSSVGPFKVDISSPQFLTYSSPTLLPGQTSFNQLITDNWSGVLDDNQFPVFYYRFNSTVINDNDFDHTTDGYISGLDFESNLVIDESNEGDQLFWRVLAKDNAGNEAWSDVHDAGIVQDDDTDAPTIWDMADQGDQEPGQYSFTVQINDASGIEETFDPPKLYFRYGNSGIDHNTFDGNATLSYVSGNYFTANITIPETRVGQDLYWRVYACDDDNSPECGWSTAKYAGKVLPLALLVDAGSDFHICPGDAATLSPSVQGGIPPYSYSWTPSSSLSSNSASNPTATPSLTTTYTVVITDNNQSQASDQVTVIVDPLPAAPITPYGSDQVCQSTQDVTYSTISGSHTSNLNWQLTPAYAGSIQNSTQPESIEIDWSSNFSGQVELKVQGANNCGSGQWSQTLHISVNSLPSQPSSIQGQGMLCQGEVQSIYFTAGAVNADDYEWEITPISAGSLNPSSNSVTVNWSAQFSGNAQLKVRGVNNCGTGPFSSVKNISIQTRPGISMNDTLWVNFGTDTVINCVVTGGSGSYSFAWNPANIFISNNIQSPQTIPLISPINASVEVTDNQTACTSSRIVTLAIKGGPLSTTASVSEDTICHGSGTILSVLTHGGASGSYSGTVTSSPPIISYTIPSLSPSENLLISPLTSCEIYISVNDGFNIVNDTVSVHVEPLPSVYNCTGSGSICSGEAGLYIPLSGSQTNVIYEAYRNGTHTGIVAQGTGQNINIGPISAQGQYTVKAKSLHTNCETWMTGTYDLIVYSLPNAEAGNPQSVTYGSSTSLSAGNPGSGSYSYYWAPTSLLSNSNTSNPATHNLTSTTQFSLTVTDQQTGCESIDQVTVYVTGGPLTISTSATSQSICPGSSTQLFCMASGGTEQYAYSWTSNPAGFQSSNPNPSAAPVTNTIYYVELTDGNDTIVDSVSISILPAPGQFSVTGSGKYCIGDQPELGLSLTELNTTYYIFNGSSNTGLSFPGTGSSYSAPIGQGLWRIYATNSVGCSKWMIDTADVSIHAPPLTDAGPAQQVSYGTTTTLNGSPSGGPGQYSYAWTPTALLQNVNVEDPLTQNLLVPTWFKLVVTNIATGCSATDSVFIDVIGGPLQAWANQSQLIVCPGESVQLQGYATNGTGNYSFLWTSIPAGLNISSQNITLTPFLNADYVLTVSDGNESLSDTLSVRVCNTPQNLHTNNTDVHSVSLSWDPVPGALHYVISHKKSNQQQWSPGTNVLTNQATVNNLDEFTSYDFRVRANCGGLSQCSFSGTASATTLACANTLTSLVAGQAYPQQLLEITNVSFLPQVPVPGSMVTMTVSWKMNSPSSRMLHANAYGSWDTLTPLGSLFAGNATTGSSVLNFVAPVSPGYHPVRLLFAFDEQAYSNYASSNLPSAFHCSTIGSSQTFRSDVQLNVQYCQPPGSVFFTDIGSQSARVNWALQPLALSYEVHYRDTSSAVWNTHSGVTANFLDLTALIPNTIYEVSVGSHCALGSVSSFSPPAFLVTDDSCFTPVNLVASTLSTPGNPNVWRIHLEWGNAGSGATYVVEQLILGNWVPMANISTTYISLSGFSIGQTAIFRVRTACNNGDFSPWSNTITHTIAAPVFSLDTCWLTDVIDINSDNYHESFVFHFDPEVDCGSHSVYLELSKYNAASPSTPVVIATSGAFNVSPGSSEDITFTIEADNINNASYSFILKVFYAGFSSPEAIWTDTTDPCLGWVPMAMYKKVDLTKSWLSYKVDLNGDTYNEQVWIAAQLRSTKDTDREVYLEVQGRTSTTPFTFLTFSDTLLLRSKTTDTIVVPVEAWLQGNYMAYFRLLVYDQDGFVTSFIAPGGHPLNAVKMQKASAPLLSLSAAGIGYGSVNINGQMISHLPYTSSYNSGTGMLLEAFPNQGSQFSVWKGDFISSANPLIFNLDSSIHLSVLFDTLDPGWNKPVPTTSVHRIFIPDSLSITVNGVPASPGDMLGVFYDSASVDRCAGQASWDGSSKTMLVYGGNGLEDIGFVSGEVFRWKLYQASTGLLFDMDAKYQPAGTVFTHDSCFASGGLSGLSKLSAGSSIALSVDAGPDLWGCSGHSHTISALASGGFPPYSFFWSNGQTTAQFSTSPMNTVSFVVNVVDQMQNTARDTIVVFVDPAPVISLSANPAVVCRGESVTLTASGAPGYFWGIQGFQLLNDSQIEFVPQHSQVVNVYNGAFGGCAGQASVFVDVQPLPSTYLISPLSLCEGSTESLLPYASPSGGTFSGSGVMGSDFQAVSLPPNNWVHYAYEDPHTGCANSDSMLVTVLEAPEIYPLQGGGDYCEDVQGVTLELPNSQNLHIYSIFRNNILLSQMSGTGSGLSFGPYQQSGDYIVTALNNTNGCRAMMANQADLSFHPLPVVNLNLLPSQLNSSQGPVLLQGGDPAGGTYSGVGVSNGYFDPSQLPPGNVMVYYAYEDSLGCAGMDSATIEVLANSLIVDLVSFPSPPYCKDEQLQLCAYISGGTPPYSTNWFIPPFYGGIIMPIQGNFDCRTLTADASMTITVFVEDALDLSTSVDFAIELNDIQLLAQAVPWEVCSGDSIQLLANANGAQVFEWMVGNDTLIGANHQYQPQMTGLATALVIDSNNCVDYADVFILVNPLPQANAGADQSIQAGDTAVLQASGGLTYQWNTQPPSLDNPISVAPLVSTEYIVTVGDINNCVALDSVWVYVSTGSGQISGWVVYQNLAKTPMSGCTVSLLLNGNVLQSTSSAMDGYFEFLNVSTGNYELTTQCTQAWGGGNSNDALLVLKNMVGLESLYGIYLAAADVDHSSYANSTDALNIAKRFVQLINAFPAGDWCIPEKTFTMSGNMIFQDTLEALCYGDVNGSHSPSGIKSETHLQIRVIEEMSLQTDKSGAFLHYPFITLEPLRLSALSLILEWPEEIQVDEVLLEGSDIPVLTWQEGEELRMAWYSLDPVYFKAGDTVFTMRIKQGIPQYHFRPAALPGSVLGDSEGNSMAALFGVPALTAQKGDFISIYPSPARDIVNVRFSHSSSPLSLYLRVTDYQGKIIVFRELTASDIAIGELHIGTAEMESGLYMIELLGDRTRISGKMLIIH